MKLSTATITLALTTLVAAMPSLPVAQRAEQTTNVVVSTAVTAHPEVEVQVPKTNLKALTTTANTGFRTLDASIADSVVICPAQNCAGTCYAYALSGLTTGICYTPQSAFFSGYLYVASGTSTYHMVASTSVTKCATTGSYLMPTNACGNLYPADGFDFYLVTG